MAVGQSINLQLRLITSHLAGVLGAVAAMPQFLGLGLNMQNVVISWVLGSALFLVLATATGLIWRRSIAYRPVRWAIAAPAVLPLTIYVLLRLLTGGESADASFALDTSMVGGLCALFASAVFLMWTFLAPAKATRS